MTQDCGQQGIRRAFCGIQPQAKGAINRQAGKSVHNRPAGDRGRHARIAVFKLICVFASDQSVHRREGTVTCAAAFSVIHIQQRDAPHEIETRALFEREANIGRTLAVDARYAREAT